jgi:catechol 2,3-dioxygenase-like lactoylglutathione lyase family enzyme
VQPDSFFHVAIKVADVDESLAFYREYFDADPVERGSATDGEGATAVDYVALDVADKLLYLFDRAPYEAAGIVDDLPVGVLHFGFVVEDVGRACDELAGDVEFLMEPTVFGDLEIAFFADPNGVRIELIEHR